MNDILWVEKYRPQTIVDCILPDELKSTFQQFVDNEEIPNLLLTGTAGVGKTTVAKAMLEHSPFPHQKLFLRVKEVWFSQMIFAVIYYMNV